jgi:prepilin-type N-terminal cleavage/methylation domain-containing protein
MMQTSAHQTECRTAGRSGFSLLEILVCLLLLGILAVGFSQVFQGSLAIGQLQADESVYLNRRRKAVLHQFAELEGAERVLAIAEDSEPDGVSRF